METLIQQLINGLVIGSVYALIALGYTMEPLAKGALRGGFFAAGGKGGGSGRPFLA